MQACHNTVTAWPFYEKNLCFFYYFLLKPTSLQCWFHSSRAPRHQTKAPADTCDLPGHRRKCWMHAGSSESPLKKKVATWEQAYFLFLTSRTKNWKWQLAVIFVCLSNIHLLSHDRQWIFWSPVQGFERDGDPGVCVLDAERLRGRPDWWAAQFVNLMHNKTATNWIS